MGLGYELLEELASSYDQAKLTSGGESGAYATLQLSHGMSVRFTSWRDGEGPFYIILFKGANYVFELDLSMIAYSGDRDRFTWNLKVPSHKRNAALLCDWLGESASFSEAYVESVKLIKHELRSGVNTPRKGHSFIGDSDWCEVCSRFLQLMQRVITTHSYNSKTGQTLFEIGNDDGSLIDTRRKARRYQSRFRINMMYWYGSRCAISGESVNQVLEAAHIVNHSESGMNDKGNALLLRSDIHKLFDAGLIAIDPNSLKVVISKKLDGSTYQRLSGKVLRARIDGSHPEAQNLAIKWTRAVMDAKAHE